MTFVVNALPRARLRGSETDAVFDTVRLASTELRRSGHFDRLLIPRQFSWLQRCSQVNE